MTCRSAVLWPGLDLAGLAAGQAAGVAVAVAGGENDKVAGASLDAIGIATFVAATALYLPSMAYGYAQSNRCRHRKLASLQTRRRPRPDPVSASLLEGPLAPLAHRCSAEVARQAAWEAIAEANLPVVDDDGESDPEVPASAPILGRGCLKSFRVVVALGPESALVDTSLDCREACTTSCQLSLADELAVLRVHASLERQLRSCTARRSLEPTEGFRVMSIEHRCPLDRASQAAREALLQAGFKLDKHANDGPHVSSRRTKAPGCSDPYTVEIILHGERATVGQRSCGSCLAGETKAVQVYGFLTRLLSACEPPPAPPPNEAATGEPPRTAPPPAAPDDRPRELVLPPRVAP